MSFSSELLGKTIFLSASFPLEEGKTWEEEYSLTINPGLVIQAVKAVLTAVFERRGSIVFGGHPAITPFVLEISKSYRKEIPGKFVKIFQSRLFEKFYSVEAKQLRELPFVDFVETPEVVENEEESLKVMRTNMFLSIGPQFAVFAGGRDGVLKEFNLFHELLPEKKLYPIGAAGGAAKKLLETSPSNPAIETLEKMGIDQEFRKKLAESRAMPFLVDKVIRDYMRQK